MLPFHFYYLNLCYFVWATTYCCQESYRSHGTLTHTVELSVSLFCQFRRYNNIALGYLVEKLEALEPASPTTVVAKSFLQSGIAARDL